MPGTWEDIFTPFLQAREGNLQTSLDDELQWFDDPLALDPFEDVFDAEARGALDPEAQAAARRTLSLDAPDVLDVTPDAMSGRSSIDTPGVNTPSEIRPPKFRLPKALTKGERTADFVAASKGVDVRAPAGTGKMFDLAKSMLGTPYVFSASNPGVAFDCSGFTKWLYSRALGVALPHSSTEQAKGLTKVGRDDLQPGDLVFFSYGRLGPGVIDHVEVYMGNGKMIGTANPSEDLDIDAVDWENFVQGGRAGSVPDTGGAPSKGGKGGQKSWNELTGDPTKPETRMKRVPHDRALAPLALADGAPAFAAVIDAMFSPDKVPIVTERNTRGGDTAKGSVWNQLRAGFIDAGRPDLARMTGTKEFQSWLRAENGALNPSLTSQHFEGHGVNYGLFQFWEGHDWTQKYVQGNRFTASPYEQAKLVAQHFGHLTPAKIREYAAQIANGDYHGWG